MRRVVLGHLLLLNNFRITREIERTLRKGVHMPRVKHIKRKIEGPKPKVQETPDTLNIPSTPLDATISSSERSPDLAPVDSDAVATTSVSGSGTSLVPLSPVLYGTSNTLLSQLLGCGRAAKRAFALHELPSLIEVIFSSQDEGDTIRRLLGDDAQAFIDVIDEVYSISTCRRGSVLIETRIAHSFHQALDRPDLSPQTGENCLKLLYRMCGRLALLPTTMIIPVSLERIGGASYRGGFADVWKEEHCGRDIAVKIIRTYSDSDLQRVIGVSYWFSSIPHACALIAPHAEVLQGGRRVENPSASERPATDRSDDVGDSVRDDIRLDGERKYQQLREGAS